MKLVLIYKTALFLMKINSLGYVCIHYIKSIAKPYQNNTSKIIKRGGEKKLAKAILNIVSVLDK